MDDRERNPDRGDLSYAGRDVSSPEPGAERVHTAHGAPSPRCETRAAGPAAPCAPDAEHTAQVVYLRDHRARRGNAALWRARRPAMPRRPSFEPWAAWPMRAPARFGTPLRSDAQRVSRSEPAAHDAWGAGGFEGSGWLHSVLHAVERLVRKLQGSSSLPPGPNSEDERIRWEVNKRLAQQGTLDPNGIDVEVSNGEVTLCGTTESRQDRYVAEEIADDVSGVIDVHNYLRVREAGGVLPFVKRGSQLPPKPKDEAHESDESSNRHVRR